MRNCSAFPVPTIDLQQHKQFKTSLISLTVFTTAFLNWFCTKLSFVVSSGAKKLVSKGVIIRKVVLVELTPCAIWEDSEC